MCRIHSLSNLATGLRASKKAIKTPHDTTRLDSKNVPTHDDFALDLHYIHFYAYGRGDYGRSASSSHYQE